MKRYLVTIISLLIFTFNYATAHSTARLALVIGNAAYEHVPELANPRNDAEAMAEKLTSLGFEVIKGLDLDLNGMRKTVRNFVNKLDGTDIALFFYAGHGLQVNGQNYMAPIDATLGTYNDLEFEALPINLVLSAMERNTKTNLVFLDACRNNPLAVNLARSMGTRSASVGRGLAPVGSGVGTLVSFSTEPGNVALDGTGKNSPYTTALIKHLGTPGEDIGLNMKSVRRDVLKATDGKQVPWEHSSLTGEVVLRIDDSVASTPDVVINSGVNAGTQKTFGNSQHRQTELVFWNSVKDSTEPEAIEIYLRRYPKGVFSGLAAVRLSALKRRQENGVQGRPVDSSTEIAYWKSIESGGSAAFFKSYIAKYPNGLFVEIANLKLAAIEEKFAQKTKRDIVLDGNQSAKNGTGDGSFKTALLTPPNAQITQVAVDKPLDRDGMRQLQRELNRLGCSAGSPDGIWGKGSRRALTNYRKHSKVKLASLEPTDGLLKSLRNVNTKICPTVRRERSVKRKKPVAKTRRASVSRNTQRVRREEPRRVIREEPRRVRREVVVEERPRRRLCNGCLNALGAIVGGILLSQ